MPSRKSRQGISGSLHQKRSVPSCKHSLPKQAFLDACICWIDATFIPSENAVEMVLSFIMDTSVVVNWPGSVHDSRIFNESCSCQTLQTGHHWGFFFGDGDYPCLSYLLTPYTNPREPHEETFDQTRIKTRSCIEMMFGILKKRFSVLATPLRNASGERARDQSSGKRPSTRPPRKHSIR